MSTAPVHPVEVRISIGGDDWDYVVLRLEELYLEARSRSADSFQMFGGGAGGSYSVTTAKRDITPEAYRQELDEWFESQPGPIATRTNEGAMSTEKKMDVMLHADKLSRAVIEKLAEHFAMDTAWDKLVKLFAGTAPVTAAKEKTDAVQVSNSDNVSEHSGPSSSYIGAAVAPVSAEPAPLSANDAEEIEKFRKYLGDVKVLPQPEFLKKYQEYCKLSDEEVLAIIRKNKPGAEPTAPTDAPPESEEEFLKKWHLVKADQKTWQGICYQHPGESASTCNVGAWYSTAVYWRNEYDKLNAFAASLRERVATLEKTLNHESYVSDKRAQERDRAEAEIATLRKALQECFIAIEGTILGTSWELCVHVKEELAKAGNLARAVLSESKQEPK